MPTVRKSKSAFAAAAAPVLLAFGSGLVKMFAGDNVELGNWLVESFTGLAAGVAGHVYHEHSQTREHAATFITGGQLCTHTGSVMEALTLDFSETEDAREYRKPLRALAKKLPGLWQNLCSDGGPVASEINSPAFLRRLADSFRHQKSHSSLSDESLRTLLLGAAAGMKSLPGDVIGRLAIHIHQRFSTATLAGLASLHSNSDRAYRETVLRFQGESIAGIERITHDLKDLPEDLRAFLRHYIANTEGLEEILAEFRATLSRIEHKLDAALTRPDTAIGAFDIILSKYRARLVEAFAAYEDLETAAISAADTGKTKKRPTRIDDIFVAPACGNERVPCRVDEFDELHGKGEHPNTPLIPLLAREDHRRVVLLADPGYGKSTLLQWLIVSLVQRPYKIEGAPALTGAIPVPIIVRDVDRKLPDDFTEKPSWEKVLTALRAVLPPRSARTAAPLFFDFLGAQGTDGDIAFHSLLDSPNSWFFVDGMDDIGDPDRRRAFRDAIWEGFRQLPQARWLITSRIIGYDVTEIHRIGWTEINGVPDGESLRPSLLDRSLWELLGVDDEERARQFTYGAHKYASKNVRFFEVTLANLIYLAPFDDSRQEHFARSWFQHQIGASNDERAHALVKEVHQHTATRVISRVPSLFCLMAILKRKGLPLPDGRAELYDRITEAYLKTVDEARGITREGHGTFTDAQARQWLSIVGIHMQRRRVAVLEERKKKKDRLEASKASDGHAGEAAASRADIEAWLLQHLRASYADEAEAQKKLTLFLQYVAARSGLLQPRGEGWYAFAHLSFMEYFAACYLRSQLDHHKELMADRREAEELGETFNESAYLQRFPKGPVPILPTDLSTLAAREEWHEVLVFLAELDTGTASFATDQRKTRLLRQLFPSLHSDTPVPIIRFDGDNRAEALSKALLPLPAVSLAIKLVRDQHLNLSYVILQAWLVRLWEAFLAWDISSYYYVHPWPVNSLLLDQSAHEAPALVALREASLRHRNLRVLLMENCPGLTDTSIFGELWPALEELSLAGCTNLRVLKNLPSSLTNINLEGCTGLSLEAGSRLKSAPHGATSVEQPHQLPIEFRGTVEEKDFFLITDEWERIDNRRCRFIEKRLRGVSRTPEEDDEFAELQRLYRLRRRYRRWLQTGNPDNPLIGDVKLQDFEQDAKTGPIP